MQILTGDEIFDRYGCPSHPVSPTPLSTPPKNMKTVGDELGENNNQTTTLQAERELSLQQPHQQRQQQLSTLPSQFPPELIDHIVDHLHDDKQSLIQCSRASRVFSHATSYHLFRTAAVPSVRSCVKFQELIQCSLHPISSTPTAPHPSTPSSASTSSSPSPPAPRTVYHQPHHLHSHSDRIHVNSPVGHAQASDCDVSAAGWDISRFVRKIEFYGLDPQSPIEEYVSEAVKLVRMLPRIREVVFAWWMQATGLEKIGQAFADISVIAGHHTHPSNRPLSSATTSTPPEARVEQIPTGDPLKLHLELVDFESVHAFLDFLGSFGGRLRELSLASITLGGGRGNGKDNVEGRYLPGLECVCLGYDVVVQPKAFGEDGPTMGGIMNTNVFFGIPAFEQTRDVCEILESVAPNVSELQLFRDDVAEVCMGLGPEARVLRLPRFRRLRSVTMYVPGPRWSDLVYEIAAWFVRDEKSFEEIADPTCQVGRASSLAVTPSLSSTSSATRANRWEDWKRRTRIRFAYPVRKGDVDWKKLERAVLGEDTEGLDGRNDRAGFGNHGGEKRETGGGNENDHVDGMVMGINQVGKHGTGGIGGRGQRFTVGSLWVEVKGGSATLGEVREELGRMDRLGLLHLSCS